MEESLLNNITTGSEKKYKTDSGDLYVFSITQKELVPKFMEVSGKEFIYYGEKNNYPSLLVECLNNSPTHKRTFDKVCLNVAGKSIKIKDGKVNPKLQSFIERCNSKGESLHDVISKISYDYTLYNGWSSSITWKRGAGLEDVSSNFEIFHTDYSTLRPAVAEPLTGVIPKYFFSQNWNTWNPTYTPVEVFNVDKQTGTQVHVYSKYASTQVYFPIPRYASAIGSILIDQKMTEFFNSYMESGCFPNIFLNVNENVEDEERRRAIVNNFQSQFKGASKAGRLIVGFSSSPEMKPDFHVIDSNHDDEKFKSLREWVRSQIVTAWNSSAEISGAPVPGKLGNSSYLENQIIFNQDVISPMKNDLEKEINYLLKCNGFTDEIEIVAYPLVYPLEEQTRRQSYTINEIRVQDGAEPIGLAGDVIILPKGAIQLPVNNTTAPEITTPNDVVKENAPSADEKISTNNN